MNELALFTGAGGGILGSHLMGWRTVCAVEIEDYARRVLLARQRDGVLPRFPIWDDVTTFNGRQWRGRIDVVSGGFPCQDISACGKGEGIEGARSGLWSQMARIIGEVQPGFVLVENSPMLTSRGLGRVLGDLASLGYDARWGVLGAFDAGASHKRNRIWIVANPCKGICGRQRRWKRCASDVGRQIECTRKGTRFASEEELRTAFWGNHNAVADRMDRLKAIGNGQVPAVVRLAWGIAETIEPIDPKGQAQVVTPGPAPHLYKVILVSLKALYLIT